MTTPLAGITVLDFGQIYQGPYATLLMAKAGANVIKIEPPGGEPLRRRVLATGKGDTTLPIAMLNANKRAMTLNLKIRPGQRRCCPRWPRAPTCCWRIFRPARWTGSASATTCCRRSTRGWSMPPAPASAFPARIATTWRWTSPSRRPPGS